MKIAICLFGLTRNLRPRTLRAFERYLFAPARELDPGFVRFGHFNLVAKLTNLRSKEVAVPLAADDHLRLGCDHLLATPQEEVDQQIDLTPFLPYGDPWNDGFASMRNLLRQYYSLERVTELLVRSGQQFDAVIFSRADLLFRNRLAIPPIEPGVLYTPQFAKNEGLNDRFALGSQPVMAAYGNRGKLAREYCDSTGKPLHAEMLLEWLVGCCGWAHRDLAIRFWRMRANGKPAGLDGPRRHFYHWRAVLLTWLKAGSTPGRTAVAKT